MAEEVFLCGTESLEKEKEEHRRLVLDKAGRFIDGTWIWMAPGSGLVL
jgi:hypothetical protein